jgi:hypothetical protein
VFARRLAVEMWIKSVGEVKKAEKLQEECQLRDSCGSGLEREDLEGLLEGDLLDRIERE